MMRLKVSGGFALLLVFVAVGWPAGPAAAHAALRLASPADGAVLRRPPGAIVLTFNEKLQKDFTTVRVTSGGGRATAAEAITDGNRVTQLLPATLPAGSYTTSYRVVSADGHPISGQVRFRLDPPRSSPQPPASSASLVVSRAAPAIDDAAADGTQDAGGIGAWVWLAGGLVVVVFIVAVFLAGRRRPSES